MFEDAHNTTTVDQKTHAWIDRLIEAAGIYRITRKATGRAYIGQAVDLDRRLAEHKSYVNRPKRKGEQHIDRSIRVHGVEAFTWEILLICPATKDALDYYEISLIAAYGTFGPGGYNHDTGGAHGIPSEDARQKMSKSAKESPKAIAQRERLRSDPEVRAKWSKSAKESPKAIAQRERLRSDPEVRAKWSKSLKIALNRPEVMAKKSKSAKESPKAIAQRERLHSDPEVRAKRSKSLKIALNRPEVRAKWSKSMKESPKAIAQRERLRSDCHRRADQRIYFLVHTDTGVVESGKRYELCARLGINSGNMSALVNGRYKTTKGWRLAAPEEADLLRLERIDRLIEAADRELAK